MNALPRIMGYRDAASAICFLHVSEPQPGPGGVYMGKTQVYRLPFFLDLASTLNPHVSVIGMSGSGKTFFLKSLIWRYSIYHELEITVIDWNGEYRELARSMCATVIEYGRRVQQDTHERIRIIDLSGLPGQAERRLAAETILSSIAERMHRSKATGELRGILVLDEAWKVLEGSSLFRSLYREGRKYGYGMVIATQMASDINNEVIANSSILALFRLRSGSDYGALVASQAISNSESEALSKLPTGSCMMVISYRHTVGQSRFCLSRVDGIVRDFFEIGVNGASMRISVSENRVRSVLLEIGVENAAAEGLVARMAELGGRMNLQDLARIAVSCKIPRHLIVTFMRGLGFDDCSIVEAYEVAIS